MQDHLHVGRRTFKRQLRDYLIFFSPIIFFVIFGVPFMRYGTPSENGRSFAVYSCIANEKYEIVDGKPAPLFILVPLWWPHKNAAAMHWVADSWDGKAWSDQR